MSKAGVKLGFVALLMFALICAIRVTNNENWLGVWFLVFLFVGLPLSLLSIRDFLLSFAASQTESKKFWLMLHVCALFAAGIGYGLGVMAESSGSPKADVQKWLVLVLPGLVYITPLLLAFRSAPAQLIMRKGLLRLLCSLLPFGAAGCDSASQTEPVYAQDQTLVRERTFHLTLPGKWVGGYNRDSDTWHYEGSSGNEAVTVGILRRTAGADPATMKEDFDGYLQVRRQEEQGLAGGSVVLTEPRIQTVRDALTARYDGFDSSSGRRTHTYVVINAKAAASYYYEAQEMSQADFDARAKQVLGHVGLVH